MARELVINTWCDACLQDDEHTDGEEITISISGVSHSKPLVLALCKSHRVEHLDGLRELLAEHGQPPEKELTASPSGRRVRREPGDWTCPKCGHESPNKAALGAHSRSIHKVTLAELEGKPTDFVCEECGRKFAKVQGLTLHRTRKHKGS